MPIGTMNTGNVGLGGISLSGAGAQVNSTGGLISTAGTGVPIDGNSLTPEMKTFYDKTLITLAGAKLVHEQFGQKRPIPKNGGKTIEFRKFSKLPKALKSITEGITPSGNKLQVSAITATVDQYGDYIEQTDMLELTAIDNTIVEATKELAEQAGLTLDTVVRNELVGGTNVYYAANAEGVRATVRRDLSDEHLLTVKDVFAAAAELKAVNAPKIDGSYVAIIHPYVAFDLMQDAKEQWIGIQKYANPENILKGEIGMLGGVRFVESTEAKIFGPEEIANGYTELTVSGAVEAGATTVSVVESLTPVESCNIPVYIAGCMNNIVSIRKGVDTTTLTFAATGGLGASLSDGSKIIGAGGNSLGEPVFATLFLGANAYGVTDITGGGLEHIVKQKGYGNDPLNQRSSVGWKATKTAKRLVEEYILRFESMSSFKNALPN